MADTNVAYASSSDLTITLASLATSSTLVAGRNSASVVNTTNKYLDYLISSMITNGTTPTANTLIEVWAIPKKNDTEWPDGFTASDAAKTVTSRGQLQNYGALIAQHNIIATTSNLVWESSNVSLCAKLGLAFGSAPKEFVIWVVHSTAVNLNSTAGNHKISITPVYLTTT